PQLSLVLKLEKEPLWYPQKNFIALLRISLHDCLGNNANLVGIIRKVKLNMVQDGEAEIQQTKVSLGKSIVNELHGAGAIPDAVDLLVPIFENHPGPKQTIRCAIDIDIPQQSFMLQPL